MAYSLIFTIRWVCHNPPYQHSACHVTSECTYMTHGRRSRCGRCVARRNNNCRILLIIMVGCDDCCTNIICFLRPCMTLKLKFTRNCTPIMRFNLLSWLLHQYYLLPTALYDTQTEIYSEPRRTFILAEAVLSSQMRKRKVEYINGIVEAVWLWAYSSILLKNFAYCCYSRYWI